VEKAGFETWILGTMQSTMTSALHARSQLADILTEQLHVLQYLACVAGILAKKLVPSLKGLFPDWGTQGPTYILT
jgi:hypothetical protein